MSGLVSQSSEAYHAAEGVSRSHLEWIHPPSTPFHYWSKYIGRTIPPEDETPALRMGSLAHRAILEPDTMGDAFYVRPEGMNFTTKEGRAWKEAHSDKPILTDGETKAIQGMRNQVHAHPLAGRLLKSGEFERSAFAEEDGLKLKSRFDCLPSGSNAIVDLKTCERADLESVEKSVAQYGYYRQAAFYLKVAGLLGLERDLFVFVFVEKNPPYAVAAYQLADEVVEAGRRTIERDLTLLRECLASNRWPGYGAGLLTAGLPNWTMKQLEEVI